MMSAPRNPRASLSAAESVSNLVRILGWLKLHQVRLGGAGILALCLTIFWIAATLTPSPDGFGTHRQLGYPPCLGPILLGHPCPTCGMTTAFAHAIRGNLPAALHAQPAGFIGFVVVMAAFICSLQAVLTKRWAARPAWLHTRSVIVFTVCVTALGWIYKLLTF